jgi:hypothetical protein
MVVVDVDPALPAGTYSTGRLLPPAGVCDVEEHLRVELRDVDEQPARAAAVRLRVLATESGLAGLLDRLLLGVGGGDVPPRAGGGSSAGGMVSNWKL